MIEVRLFATLRQGRGKVFSLDAAEFKCGRDILEYGYSVRELCHAAEVPESYISEIHQGINLSEYVVLRDE